MSSKYYFNKKISLKNTEIENLRGIFTWPNQDDRMNMTKIGENDRKVDNDER